MRLQLSTGLHYSMLAVNPRRKKPHGMAQAKFGVPPATPEHNVAEWLQTERLHAEKKINIVFGGFGGYARQV